MPPSRGVPLFLARRYGHPGADGRFLRDRPRNQWNLYLPNDPWHQGQKAALQGGQLIKRRKGSSAAGLLPPAESKLHRCSHFYSDADLCVLAQIRSSQRSSPVSESKATGNRPVTLQDYENQTIMDLDYLIPHGRTVFTLLLTLDFWAAAGCYAVLALFMYFAVRHPMLYMVKMTDRRTSKWPR